MIDPEVKKLVEQGIGLRTAYRMVRKEKEKGKGKRKEPKYEYSKGRWV